MFVWYCTVPAFAVESTWRSDASDNVVITPSGNVANNRISEYIDGTLWTLESVSYSNGDCCFILYEGSDVAARSYVHANQRTITSSTKVSIEAIDIVINMYWIVIHLYHLMRARKMRQKTV